MGRGGAASARHKAGLEGCVCMTGAASLLALSEGEERTKVWSPKAL